MKNFNNKEKIKRKILSEKKSSSKILFLSINSLRYLIGKNRSKWKNSLKKILIENFV